MTDPAMRERERIVAFLRNEPASGKADIRTRLTLAWLFFRRPHEMIERSANLIADRIQRGDHHTTHAQGGE